MNQQDVERIARAALRDLGEPGVVLTVSPDPQRSGSWRIDLQGGHGRGPIRIACGEGSSAQWVRDQVVEQFLARG